MSKKICAFLWFIMLKACYAEVMAQDYHSEALLIEVEAKLETLPYLEEADSVMGHCKAGRDFQEVVACVYQLGSAYDVQNYYTASKEIFNTLLQYAKWIESPSVKAETHFMLGLNYFALGLYGESIFHHALALDIAEKNELDTSLKSSILLNQAAAYRNAGQLEKALQLYNILPEQPREFGYWKHYHRGYTYLQLGNLDKAKADFDNIISQEWKRPDFWVHNVMGDLYMKKGDVSASIAEYKMALAQNVVNEQEQKCHTLIGLGNAYFLDGNYPKAQQYLQKGHNIALQHQLNKHIISSAKLLTQVTEKIGNKKDMLAYSEVAIKELENLYSKQIQESSVIKINTLLEYQQAQNKLLEEQHKIAQMQSTRRRAYIFATLGLTVLFAVIAVFYQRVAKNRESRIRQINTLSAELEKTNQLLQDANQKLEDSNESLRYFASIAAHDMKAPLRTISSFSKLISRRLDPQDENTQLLDYVVGATNQMAKLVDDLLAFSQVGKDLPDATPVNLNEVLEQTLLSLDADLKDSKANLEIGNLPTIKAHYSLLEMLFQNLLSNAIKFRKREVPLQITIAAQQVGDYWEIRVQDNGIGIKKEAQKEIFLIFRKVHANIKVKVKGSGIGLSTCDKIARFYNGDIRVESIYGEGSTFIIRLPVAEVS